MWFGEANSSRRTFIFDWIAVPEFVALSSAMVQHVTLGENKKLHQERPSFSTTHGQNAS
jgi:hypothetical protein